MTVRVTRAQGMFVSGLVLTGAGAAVLKCRDGGSGGSPDRRGAPPDSAAIHPATRGACMPDSKQIHEGQTTLLTADGHLAESTQRWYILALLSGTARDPTWAEATEHLTSCTACVESAVRSAKELVGESPDWQLLEPGEFARRAQELWIRRLQEHKRAPIREAAARELGALDELGGDGYCALVAAAVEDSDENVRLAAKDALAETHARQPLRGRLRNWVPA